MIKYTKKSEKYVFNKGGIYFSLTLEQVLEMEELLNEIRLNSQCTNMVKNKISAPA